MINNAPDVNLSKETEIASTFEKFLITTVEGSKFPKSKKVLYGAVSRAIHFVKNIIGTVKEALGPRGAIDQLYIDVRTQKETLTHISLTILRTKNGVPEKEQYDLRNRVLRDGPFTTSRICGVDEIIQLQSDIEQFISRDAREVNVYYDLISAYNLFEKRLQTKEVYTFFVDGDQFNDLNVIKLSDGRIHLQHVHNTGSISYTSSIFLKKIEKNKVVIDKTEKYRKDFKFVEDEAISRFTGGVARIPRTLTVKVPASEVDEIMNSAILGLLI